jgi:hypothetical protein
LRPYDPNISLTMLGVIQTRWCLMRPPGSQPAFVARSRPPTRSHEGRGARAWAEQYPSTTRSPGACVASAGCIDGRFRLPQNPMGGLGCARASVLISREEASESAGSLGTCPFEAFEPSANHSPTGMGRSDEPPAPDPNEPQRTTQTSPVSMRHPDTRSPQSVRPQGCPGRVADGSLRAAQQAHTTDTA